MAGVRITSQAILQGEVSLPVSKSIANRLLVLCGYGNLPLPDLDLNNAPNDVCIVYDILKNKRDTSTWDIEDSGTAMRFLLSYAAFLNEDRFITGSKRMQQRPIDELVDKLNLLGYDVRYESKEGFPPVRIVPVQKKNPNTELHFTGKKSSQFISSILLMAPFLEHSTEITYSKDTASPSYIELTLDILTTVGIDIQRNPNHIKIRPNNQKLNIPQLENDWSSACYFYSLIACSQTGSEITLPNLSLTSRQPDAQLVSLFSDFGVQTMEHKSGITLTKTNQSVNPPRAFDFTNVPDQAMTLICCYAAHGKELKATGLRTLQHKESPRITVLVEELTELGAVLNYDVDEDILHLKAGTLESTSRPVQTHDDHRIAMSFAAITPKVDFINIADSSVCKKSFPGFFDELRKVGLEISPLLA